MSALDPAWAGYAGGAVALFGWIYFEAAIRADRRAYSRLIQGKTPNTDDRVRIGEEGR